MATEGATYLHALDSAKPAGSELKSDGDDHLRMLKLCLKNTIPGLNGRMWREQVKSGSYALAVTDNMTVITVTAAGAAITASSAVLGAGFMCFLRIQPGFGLSCTTQWDGGSVVTYYHNEFLLVMSTGTNIVGDSLGPIAITLRANNGYVYLGTSVASQALYGLAATTGIQLDTNDILEFTRSSNNLRFSVGGTSYWSTQSNAAKWDPVYTQTTAAAADVAVDSAGQLRRSTSLRAAKTNIVPLIESDVVDRLSSVSFDSILEADQGRRFLGFVAEDVAAVEPLAATYDREGAVNGVSDRALIALLWAEVKSLRARVAALEA